MADQDAAHLAEKGAVGNPCGLHAWGADDICITCGVLAERVAECVPIEITARDTASGDSDTMTIRNDYCLVTAGAAEVTSVNVHHKADGTQTHVITVKGVRRG